MILCKFVYIMLILSFDNKNIERGPYGRLAVRLNVNPSINIVYIKKNKIKNVLRLFQNSS